MYRRGQTRRQERHLPVRRQRTAHLPRALGDSTYRLYYSLASASHGRIVYERVQYSCSCWCAQTLLYVVEYSEADLSVRARLKVLSRGPWGANDSLIDVPMNNDCYSMCTLFRDNGTVSIEGLRARASYLGCWLEENQNAEEIKPSMEVNVIDCERYRARPTPWLCLQPQPILDPHPICNTCSLISLMCADPTEPTTPQAPPTQPPTTTRSGDGGSGGGRGDNGGGSSPVVWILVGVVSLAIVVIVVGAAAYWFFKIRTASASTPAEHFSPSVELSKV